MENLQKYLKHLPTCWTQQDYSELDDALAHTPVIFRDENWLKFYEDITKKRNTCNCGYDETIGYYYPLPFIEWFRTIEFYNIFNEELHVNGLVWTTDDGKKFTTVKEIYDFWRELGYDKPVVKNSESQPEESETVKPYMTVIIKLHPKQQNPQTAQWYMTTNGQKKLTNGPVVVIHTNNLNYILDDIDLREIIDIKIERKRCDYQENINSPLKD